MEWYEPKEKTSRVDWRCDTPYYNFKITDITKDYYALWETTKKGMPDYFIKCESNIGKLFHTAWALNLHIQKFNKD